MEEERTYRSGGRLWSQNPINLCLDFHLLVYEILNDSLIVSIFSSILDLTWLVAKISELIAMKVLCKV